MNLPSGICGVFFYLFFGLSIFASLLNILFAYLEKEKLRRASKPFCLLFISLALILAVPHEPLIYAGALLGLAGDIILIFKEKKICVGAGSLVFLFGHICYIAEIVKIIYSRGLLASLAHPWVYWLLGVVGFMLLMIWPMYRLTKHSKVFTLIGIFYSTILLSVGASAIVGICLGLERYFFLIVVGDVFFVASDSTLAYTIFIENIKRKDYYIMLTYLLGEYFILSGLVLTVLA
jgi:hypothetical protein